MPFLDHLEELRWHIIRSGIAIILAFVLSFLSMAFIFKKIILAPITSDFITYKLLCKVAYFLDVPEICIQNPGLKLQSRQLAGQFTMHLLLSLVGGIIIAFPYVVWEIWRFIEPGLLPNEQRAIKGSVVSVSILFFVGILFGYFIVAPLSIQFLSNYKIDDSIENIIDITSYVSTLSLLVLSCGIIFQLPVIILFLTKLGLISHFTLRKYRKHAIVGVFLISAIITPSPDVLTQLLVAIPLLILYEISIIISYIQQNK